MKPNPRVPLSTGVEATTEASKPMPKKDTQTNRSLPAQHGQRKRIEAHPRNLNKKNHVDSRVNSKNSVLVKDMFLGCYDCGKCLFSANHDKCVVCYLKYVNAKPSSAKRASISTKQVWRAKRKVMTSVRQEWKPTGRTLSLYDSYPLTRIADPEEVPLRKSPSINSSDSRIADPKATPVDAPHAN